MHQVTQREGGRELRRNTALMFLLNRPNGAWGVFIEMLTLAMYILPNTGLFNHLWMKI
jgi:hypothetical protein